MHQEKLPASSEPSVAERLASIREKFQNNQVSTDESSDNHELDKSTIESVEWSNHGFSNWNNWGNYG